MSEEIKKRRGRPKKVVEEVKQEPDDKAPGKPVALELTEEEKYVNHLNELMAKAQAQVKSQMVLPKEHAQNTGNQSEVVFVSPNKEIVIEDEPKSRRPPFVTKDDEGWNEIPF